tara:strand:- start:815 stop:1069 length:255 start_codon:yes stop_codon:yes gene_type:complete
MTGSDKSDKDVVTFVVKKGERIPRKPLGEYSEANSIGHAISRDGLLGTAFNDKNQYGPVSMMILLLIVATVTGIALKVLSTFFA